MSSIIDKTLLAVLETATGESVYALRKPLKASLPSIVFMRVTDTPQITMSGTSSVNRTRYQITVQAKSYDSLRTIADAIESALLANTTNFSVSLPLEGQTEDKAEDGSSSIYTSIRDYFVWHKTPSLFQRIINTQYANLIQYLPFNEDVGSGVACDYSSKGNSGVYSGVTLGVEGMGDGNTGVRLNGTSSYINAYSPSLNVVFNGNKGTIILWCRINDVGVWTDGTINMSSVVRVDATNRIMMQKPAANNRISYFRFGGADTEFLNKDGVTTVAPFMIAMTWSKDADETKMYFYDEDTGFAQVGATQTGLDTWAGNLNSTLTNVGAESQAGSSVWKGDLFHHAMWDTVLTEAELENFTT